MYGDFPFEPGRLAVLVLREPRERMWGKLLRLEPAGVALRGIELGQWEQAIAMIKNGETEHVAIGTRFFPMHRVEMMYADEINSGVESLATSFLRRTGIEPMWFLGEPETR